MAICGLDWRIRVSPMGEKKDVGNDNKKKEAEKCAVRWIFCGAYPIDIISEDSDQEEDAGEVILEQSDAPVGSENGVLDDKDKGKAESKEDTEKKN
ncbi:hypothetical protein CEXT_142171 [Caerostris extrusa]|uniref:Uncharacterized protein n=1 Tax=Caerostris extrusa TaxID=172846 RepID=A0AAV4M705_CAEEX|nr:hypothetical protein CEXT_142171 [Caerostris extrusa]